MSSLSLHLFLSFPPPALFFVRFSPHVLFVSHSPVSEVPPLLPFNASPLLLFYPLPMLWSICQIGALTRNSSFLGSRGLIDRLLTRPHACSPANGAICPFGLVSPCLKLIFVQFLRPIPLMRPIVVWLGFGFLLQTFQLFLGLGTQIHHLSCSTPQIALSTLEKRYALKGNVQC